ncbi:hypothetical protein EBME_0490 [bacterium endosymbiont of Mortierella elongata FMR23-6]|nr:hypothetical protein EBME_0490 [bacterium endosymbiont of Mortierella elongata FMR23-6]
MTQGLCCLGHAGGGVKVDLGCAATPQGTDLATARVGAQQGHHGAADGARGTENQGAIACGKRSHGRLLSRPVVTVSPAARASGVRRPNPRSPVR